MVCSSTAGITCSGPTRNSDQSLTSTRRPLILIRSRGCSAREAGPRSSSWMRAETIRSPPASIGRISRRPARFPTEPLTASGIPSIVSSASTRSIPALAPRPSSEFTLFQRRQDRTYPLHGEVRCAVPAHNDDYACLDHIGGCRSGDRQVLEGDSPAETGMSRVSIESPLILRSPGGLARRAALGSSRVSVALW